MPLFRDALHRGLLATAAAALLIPLAAGTARSQDDAWAACQAEDPATAIEGCTAVLADASPDAAAHHQEAYLLRGNAYFARRELRNAIADLDVVIEQDPENAAAFTTRGQAYFESGLYDNSIDDLDHAIEIESTPERIQLLRRSEGAKE